MGKLINKVETASRLGVTRQTIENWISKGYISVKKIGKTCYIDEDTINALQDTVDDIKRQQKAIENIRKELHRDYMMRYDEKVENRYMHFMVCAAKNSGIFSTMVQLMSYCDCLNIREAAVLRAYLNGSTLEEISSEYGLTRERIRQIVEKSIRKSRDLRNIEKKLREAEEISKKNIALKHEITTLKERLGKNDVEKREDELSVLLSTKITDVNFSVRVMNVLKAFRNKNGYVDIETIGDICRINENDFLMQRNAGKKSLREITEFLESRGLSFGMDVDSLL